MKVGINCASHSLVVNVNNGSLVQPPILDLRPHALYKSFHLINSASFPVADLPFRLHELPVRSQSLCLFGSSSELKQATEFLSSRGYKICQTQIADQSILLQLKESNLYATGDTYQRLWKPANIVRTFVEYFANKCKNKKGLDLACGAGRDCVFLATQGWEMTGVDSLSSALERLSDLASRSKQSVKTLCLDLESSAPEKGFIQLASLDQRYGCVVVVRYLHRPNLQFLKELIDINGYIVYQTFLRGCEKFGSPKNPRFLLERDELAGVFSDFEILIDEIEYLSDGRPTNRFIARKIN